jgi:hypothetical protein
MCSFETKNDEEHKQLVYNSSFNASELSFGQNYCHGMFIGSITWEKNNKRHIEDNLY